MDRSSPQPDIRRALKERLLELSPRAFELFAGDLLVYIGLENIAVTRYQGDGGIDAHGELRAQSQLVAIPAGVQVKRQRRNVQRPDMDRFLGALAANGAFSHGIFMTTADYAPAARHVRGSTMRIDAINGDEIVALMRQHSLGIEHNRLDQSFFEGYETPQPDQMFESKGLYTVEDTLVTPEQDLISLRALSYALHVDPATIRRRVERGELHPDQEPMFFRRNRIAAIRELLGASVTPESAAEWRQAFLDFVQSRTMSRSYKPVLIKALAQVVNQWGEAHIDDLTTAFKAFYVDRQNKGLIVEQSSILAQDARTIAHEVLRKLIIDNPLDRFLIQGFLHFDPATGIIRFQADLWQGLRYHELLLVLRAADEQLAYYYARL